MSQLSDKLITHFRKQYFADKLGPTYRDEFKTTQRLFNHQIVGEELAYTKGFSDCKEYLDKIIYAYENNDRDEVDRLIDDLIDIDKFAKETY